MAKYLKLLILIVLLIVVIVRVNPHESKHPHFHAGFIVIDRGEVVDFSGPQYMHIGICAEAGHSLEVDEQLEKAHLHDGVGDVVHVHRSYATWQDLFHNLDFPIDGTYSAYLNQESTTGILNQTIAPYDSLVLILGETATPAAFLDQAVTRERIETIEAMSADCTG
jgi:hypothetical protein